jgi:hypothetical protein
MPADRTGVETARHRLAEIRMDLPPVTPAEVRAYQVDLGRRLTSLRQAAGLTQE